MPFPPSLKDSYLKRKYGIGIDEYNEMLAKNNFSCMICGLLQEDHNCALHVDHNHETLNVRGILCTNCNTGLGHARDSIDLLDSMINYIILWSNSEWEWIDQEKFFFKRSFWKPGDFKKCSCCEQWRRVDLWFKTTNRSDRNYKQYRPYCTACNSAEMKRRDGRRRPNNLKNGETYKTVKRKYSEFESLRAKKDSYYNLNFGITYDDYIKISAIQQHKCFICRSTSNNSKPLAVDHCHATGKIRGLLCFSCNAALGMFDDNINVMKNCIKYLKENEK